MAFKMNGHTLPGIKQSKEGKMADGRAVAEEAPAITMKKNLKVGVPKLVGKQKNIDKNKNGKIDAGDFKAMKNGPTKKSKY